VAARGISDFALVWISRAYGLATVLSGRLHRGTAGWAGEIGYLYVPGARATRLRPSRRSSGRPALVPAHRSTRRQSATWPALTDLTHPPPPKPSQRSLPRSSPEVRRAEPVLGGTRAADRGERGRGRIGGRRTLPSSSSPAMSGSAGGDGLAKRGRITSPGSHPSPPGSRTQVPGEAGGLRGAPDRGSMTRGRKSSPGRERHPVMAGPCRFFHIGPVPACPRRMSR
jgi:hypothetical protein